MEELRKMIGKLTGLFGSKKANKPVPTTGLCYVEASTQTNPVQLRRIHASTSTSDLMFKVNGTGNGHSKRCLPSSNRMPTKKSKFQ